MEKGLCLRSERVRPDPFSVCEYGILNKKFIRNYKHEVMVTDTVYYDVIKDGKIVYCAGHTGLYKVNLKTKKVKRIYIRKIRAPVKKEETAKPQQRIKG